MAIFYTGKRPVTKGRNVNDNVHTWKGTVGTYSNWSLFNSSHVLDGAPNEHHEPGSGNFPHGLQMSRWFRGLDTQQPLDGPGAGPALTWYTLLSTLIARNGSDAQDVFYNYGHADRETSYSLWSPWTYHGITTSPLLDEYGHAQRAINAPGTANWFGTFGIFTYKGVTSRPLSSLEGGVPDGIDNDYGHNRINEWHGVPSAKALG